jgi:HTH-type transcriptional regulator/antitoxin HipB
MPYTVCKSGDRKMEQIARTTKQLGAAIRRRRRALNLRQADLGAKTKLRQATISALENGEPGTQLRTLTDVMASLGLELVIRERSRSGEKIEDLF